MSDNPTHTGRSTIHQQASRREMSDLRRTSPRSDCTLAFPAHVPLDGAATTWAS